MWRYQPFRTERRARRSPTSPVVRLRCRREVTPSHSHAVVAERLGSDVERVMSHRVDPSLLQPRDQKRPSSDMDDSELNELVRIEIGASPIEPLKDAIPKPQVYPSTRNGSPTHRSSAAAALRNRPVPARPGRVSRASARKSGPSRLRGSDSRDFVTRDLGRSRVVRRRWKSGYGAPVMGGSRQLACDRNAGTVRHIDWSGG